MTYDEFRSLPSDAARAEYLYRHASEAEYQALRREALACGSDYPVTSAMAEAHKMLAADSERHAAEARRAFEHGWHHGRTKGAQ